MEKQMALKRPVLYVAAATVSILMVPFLAMQFTDEVHWSVGDFIIMGALVFCIGLAYVFISRFANHLAYKAAVAMALGTTFLMIWGDLGVGLIGSGPNAGNLMYMGVVAVAITGTLLSRFSPGGMERVMYATAGALVLHTVIALLAGMNEYPGSSVTEIIGVNGLFTVLYAISGVLFRYAGPAKPTVE